MASDGKNAIMIAIGKAKKKPSFDRDQGADSGDDASPGDDYDKPPSEDEIAAVRAFSSASSDEERAKALKTFIQICQEDD